MSKADEPQRWWSSPENEDAHAMPVAFTSDELSAIVRTRERLNTAILWATTLVMLAIAAALLYNVYRIDHPWIRVGQAWTLAVVVYLFAPVGRRTRRIAAGGEPCAEFLEREHDERRRGYLWIRRRLPLLIPGMAACAWGARSMASAPGAPLFAATALALALVWVAFGKAAEKTARDRDEVRARRAEETRLQKHNPEAC